ncbi:MAG TPA: pitrilysin family protein [Gemmatimonadaceae bacterium]
MRRDARRIAHARGAVTPPNGLSPSTVLRSALGNGLTVLVHRDASAPVVAIVTHVNAGYFDETDDVTGIAHVMEHMYFKGTPRRGVGEIPRATKAAGGYLNAGTIYDRTSYYTVLPSNSFLDGLEIQSDAYANSLIDAGELGRELEVIIQEARRKADTPGAVAVETLYRVLHDRHRMRRWRIGTEEGLRRLRREHVVAFYRAYYQPSNTILAIVGDVDPDAALAAAEHSYGGLSDRPVRRDRGPGESTGVRGLRFADVSGDVTQAQLVMGWRTPPALDHDTPRLETLATVLGSGRASRLYRSVRDRALAASIGASNYAPTELGVFTVYADGPPESSADVARAVWAEVHDLREHGATADELFRARRLYEARFARGLETMEGQANWLADWQALGDWTLGLDHYDRRMAVEPRDIADVASRWLDLDAAGVVCYRPDAIAPLAAQGGELRDRVEASPRPAPVGGAPAAPPIASAAVAPAPALERDEARVRCYRTAGGTPLLVRRIPDARLAHLAVFVAGGACDEPAAHAGLTALLVRTALKGTAHRDAARLAADAELLGGSISPVTGTESFGWSISVPTSRVDDALALLADVAQFPALREDALDTERQVAITTLALLRDDMQQWPMRMLGRAAFRGHPYGVPASGDEASLGTIDVARLRAWHGTHGLAGQSVIAIVGDVDPDHVARGAARHFGALRAAAARAPEAPLWTREPVMMRESRDKAQTAMAMAFPSPDRGDDARFAMHLLAGVGSGLGGRFFEELRDRRSLAYTVSAGVVEHRRAGVFRTFMAVSPGREDEARQAMLHELAKLGEAPVTDIELARAKAYAIGMHAIREQSGAAVLGDVLDAWMFGRSLLELGEHDARIGAVTAAEMQRLAQRYLDANRRVEAVVAGTPGPAA